MLSSTCLYSLYAWLLLAVRYMLSPVRLSVVCPSSVTFVRPTQVVQIFGNISIALGTFAMSIHGDRPMEPLCRGSETQEGLPSIGISDLSTALSRKRCKIGGKLLLITNRKSYMSFRLVPKLVTSNDLERRNGVILRYFSEFG